ncbi:MAG: hypothetical protein ABI670_12705 [Chloroflexota bacterium]
MRLELTQSDAPVRRLWSAWGFLLRRVLMERALWLSLLFGLVVLVLAYQSPRSIFVDIGGPLDGPHISGFHAPENNAAGDANFRWSMGRGTLIFQGIGKPLSAFPATLQLSSGRTASAEPLAVSVAVNGHPVQSLALKPESAPYTITIDPAWLDLSGDVQISFTTATFQSGSDKRDLGFLADFARVDLPTGATLPSIGQLLGLLLSALLLYFLLRAVWLRHVAAGLLTGGFLLLCAAVIAVQRLLLTIFTQRLLTTLLLALLVILLAEPLLRLVTRAAGWRGDRAVPEWAWTGLRGLVVLSLILKVGGLLYPHTFIIDAPFHIKYVTYMHEGRPFEEYFGKNLALSVMPPDEWGSAKAFIPYSPFFYVVAAPLAGLPVPLDLSIPTAAGIFEALRVALVFLIALALGTARRSEDPDRASRVALVAAGIYSAVPATFLLQQFGNWPTQTSLWLLTLWIAVTCLFWRRATRPAVWIASTVALTLTMLSYTVTAVYVGIFIGLLVVLGWLFAPDERKKWSALALSAVAAMALSVLIYYGRYVGDILGSTLPTFGNAIEEQGKLTTLRTSWYDFFTGHLARAMQSYKLDIIYALGLAGTLWLFLGRGWRHRRGVRAARQKPVYALIARPTSDAGAAPIGRWAAWQAVWLGSWLLLFPLFTFADFWVDQALKEFWIALPAVAIVSGTWLLALRARAANSMALRIFLYLIPATLIWQSISLWVFRLFFHNR